jgi:hypothetical protein
VGAAFAPQTTVWPVAAWLNAYPRAGYDHYDRLLGRTVTATWLSAFKANAAVVGAFAAETPLLVAAAHFVAA